MITMTTNLLPPVSTDIGESLIRIAAVLLDPSCAQTKLGA